MSERQLIQCGNVFKFNCYIFLKKCSEISFKTNFWLTINKITNLIINFLKIIKNFQKWLMILIIKKIDKIKNWLPGLWACMKQLILFTATLRDNLSFFFWAGLSSVEGILILNFLIFQSWLKHLKRIKRCVSELHKTQ